LLTTEVSLSLWFFYWFIKVQLLASYFAGSLHPILTGFTSYQRVGVIAYVGLVLWEVDGTFSISRDGLWSG